MFISGDVTDKGWESQEDGELISGGRFHVDLNGEARHYNVVKPDAFSAAGSDCVLRPNWRLAMCTTKYGNVRNLTIISCLC